MYLSVCACVSLTQTLLVSATMPSDVRGIAGVGMRDEYAYIDTVGEEENTHQHVPQHVLVTTKEAQAPQLLALVKEAMQVPPSLPPHPRSCWRVGKKAVGGQG